MKNLLFLLFALHSFFISANNLKIHDVHSTASGFAFTISWQHSWNYVDTLINNHDAAWIFLKIREKGSEWKTLQIENQDIQSQNSTFRIKTPTNLSGFMLVPFTTGDFASIEDKILIQAILPKFDFELKIFGIEMVSIPQGKYCLGDGISLHHFYSSVDSLPVKIESEAAIQLYAKDDSILRKPLSEGFPKGFAAFYAMKYEISQQEYVDFLNCLSYTQQGFRTTKSPDSKRGTLAFAPDFSSRNGIVVSVSGQNSNKAAVYECNADADKTYSENDDATTRAMNWLNWADLAAYLDWAGLRPLSELEFEKLARGEKQPVKGEFAWGTPFATDANTVLDAGTPWERVEEQGNDSLGLANFGYEGLTGALRCGFAATAGSNRVESGSSYYGAKELSGNVWEICVSAAYSYFSAQNGDGQLDLQGFANQSAWCPSDASGTIYRGGAWSSGIYEVGNWRDLAISDRYYYYLKADTRRSTVGGRGAISF